VRRHQINEIEWKAVLYEGNYIPVEASTPTAVGGTAVQRSCRSVHGEPVRRGITVRTVRDQ
jgi:hypothetical protein